jgi:hypothetical protein
LSALFLANQLSDILAARAETAGVDLLVYEGLEGVWQRDVHRCHIYRLGALAKFGKHWPGSPVLQLVGDDNEVEYLKLQ